jgi:hypothetical protein
MPFFAREIVCFYYHILIQDFYGCSRASSAAPRDQPVNPEGQPVSKDMDEKSRSEREEPGPDQQV